MIIFDVIIKSNLSYSGNVSLITVMSSSYEFFQLSFNLVSSVLGYDSEVWSFTFQNISIHFNQSNEENII